eukprot:m51a1_g14557 hypothetical protein (253) ;mRNA; r:1022800-1023558
MGDTHKASRASRQECSTTRPTPEKTGEAPAATATAVAEAAAADSQAQQQYSIEVLNSSVSSKTVVVCQASANAAPSVRCLAWQAEAVAPQGRLSFEWRDDGVDFVWSLANLESGRFTGAQKGSARVDRGNEVRLGRDDMGAYRFYGQQQSSGQSGRLAIKADGTVVPTQVAAGLAVGGAATLAVQAEPNVTYVMQCEPLAFRVAATLSAVRQGDVLTARADASALVRFPGDGRNKAVVELRPDNTWGPVQYQ